MVSLRYFKTQYNRLRWWQLIIITLVALYILKLLIKGFNIQTPQLNLQGVENYTNNTLTCTMYHTTWCGYCKQAKPEWEKILGEFDGKTVNGTQILIAMVDGDENPESAKQAGVEGYPTFKFELDGKYLDYNGGRTYTEFKKYIESVVQLPVGA